MSSKMAAMLSGRTLLAPSCHGSQSRRAPSCLPAVPHCQADIPSMSGELLQGSTRATVCCRWARRRAGSHRSTVCKSSEQAAPQAPAEGEVSTSTHQTDGQGPGTAEQRVVMDDTETKRRTPVCSAHAQFDGLLPEEDAEVSMLRYYESWALRARCVQQSRPPISAANASKSLPDCSVADALLCRPCRRSLGRIKTL